MVTVCGTERMDVGNDCLIVEQSNIIYLLAKPEDTGKRSNFRSILANTTLYGIIKSNLQGRVRMF
jgi:hypothetical protein